MNIWRYVSLGLACGLLYAWVAWPKPAPQVCPRPDVMQLDPETIRARPAPGTWL